MLSTSVAHPLDARRHWSFSSLVISAAMAGTAADIMNAAQSSTAIFFMGQTSLRSCVVDCLGERPAQRKPPPGLVGTDTRSQPYFLWHSEHLVGPAFFSSWHPLQVL